MSRWLTAIVAAGVLSAGLTAHATPALAGSFFAKASADESNEDPEPLEKRIATAREAAAQRSQELANEYVNAKADWDALVESRNIYLFPEAISMHQSALNVSKNLSELHAETVKQAEITYARAIENADMALQVERDDYLKAAGESYITTIENLLVEV